MFRQLLACGLVAILVAGNSLLGEDWIKELVNGLPTRDPFVRHAEQQELSHQLNVK